MKGDNLITTEKLLSLAPYLTIIHHSKGRLRVRVSPKIKELAESVSLKDIESLPLKIEGIKKIKINKLLGSITVEYDNDIFKKELWDNLIDGKDLEEVSAIINTLYKEVA